MFLWAVLVLYVGPQMESGVLSVLEVISGVPFVLGGSLLYLICGHCVRLGSN